MTTRVAPVLLTVLAVILPVATAATVAPAMNNMGRISGFIGKGVRWITVAVLWVIAHPRVRSWLIDKLLGRKKSGAKVIDVQAKK